MQILTVENYSLDLSKLPNEVEDDLRFSVLDNDTPNNPDFYFQPLIFLESFNAPAVVLKISGREITMPLDWNIAVGCPDAGTEVEIVPLTSLNDRGFKAFIFNPITSFRHHFSEVEVMGIYNDVKWYFPKLKPNHLLSVPISKGVNPPCAFFIKDLTKNSEAIDLHKLLA